jgi:signal transduction histidine kinase
MTRQSPSQRKAAKESASPVRSIDDRFAVLTAQFETLKAQVRQAQQLASLGTAAAMIAHEVNNLLTPILAYADSALQSNDIEFAKKALGVTARNARMLISMSGRMLELGAAKPQQREKTDLRQAVTEALASMCRDLEKDGISFAMKIEEGLCVLADPLQLRQILFNLFLNAREAMAAGHSGRMTVTANRQQGNRATRQDDDAYPIGNCVVIEVRNTGPAIPPELLPNIFEAFQSSKPARQNGKVRCSGLGLALVRDLVHENNGTIDVTSTEQTGTTFKISLPTVD